MPDVDEAVRILSYACTDEFSKLAEREKTTIIDKFKKIDKDNIPDNFKKVSNIDKVLLSLNSRIRDYLQDYYNGTITEIRSDSNTNVVGSDLIVTVSKDNKKTNKAVELKFGKKTDRALGMDSFDKIFYVMGKKSFFKETFHDIRMKQLKYAEESPGNNEGLIKNLHFELKKLNVILDQYVEKGMFYIDSDQMYQQMDATGSVTKELAAHHPDRFYILVKEIEPDPILELDGKWTLERIESSDDISTARITFHATNGKTMARIMLNWKNNYTYKGFKYPARTGLNSYSFNAWLEEKK